MAYIQRSGLYTGSPALVMAQMDLFASAKSKLHLWFFLADPGSLLQEKAQAHDKHQHLLHAFWPLLLILPIVQNSATRPHNLACGPRLPTRPLFPWFIGQMRSYQTVTKGTWSKFYLKVPCVCSVRPCWLSHSKICIILSRSFLTMGLILTLRTLVHKGNSNGWVCTQ